MKFKVLFITFNIVLFLSFLTIFLLPFFILDGSFMLEFWSKNWYFGLIFIIILGIVNAAFISNWKMLSFLEREDWPALSSCSKRKLSEKSITASGKYDFYAIRFFFWEILPRFARLRRNFAQKNRNFLFLWPSVSPQPGSSPRITPVCINFHPI